jgi:hypothetical protein
MEQSIKSLIRTYLTHLRPPYSTVQYGMNVSDDNLHGHLPYMTEELCRASYSVSDPQMANHQMLSVTDDIHALLRRRARRALISGINCLSREGRHGRTWDGATPKMDGGSGSTVPYSMDGTG